VRPHRAGCSFVARADSEEDLLLKAVEHARSAHGVEHASEALKAKIRTAIIATDAD
jgi:predicted small metal-binding protein